MVNIRSIRHTKSEPDLNLESNDTGNLDRFLKAVAPSVNAQYQYDVPSWCQPYFELSKLWEAYEEWSTMALGVTLVPEGRVPVEQYYVPLLSGIELYQPQAPSETMKLLSGMSQGDDIESNSAFFQNLNWNNQLNRGSSNKNMNSHLLYHYLENEKPNQRKPLFNKILELAAEFPELMTLKSCNLLPDSWFSVLWCPSYRIPIGATMQPLPVSFLTFHSLSTPKRGHPRDIITYRHDRWFGKISLPPFGLATYKYDFSHPIWKSRCGAHHERMLIDNMQLQANLHMRILQVEHPDLVLSLSNGRHWVQSKVKKYIRR